MSSSGSGVPDSQGLVESARSASSVSKFVGGGIGGIFMGLVYLVVSPLQAGAVGAGQFVNDFLSNVSSVFNDSFIGNLAGLLDAGAIGTQSWLRGEAAGFIIAFVIVLALAWLYARWQDWTDSDIPFLGNIPFYGTEDDN